MTDQNGTQHNYTLDNLGRQVSDTAAVLGTGVYGGTGNPAVAGDPAVRRIDTAYDLLGDVDLTTSYSSTSGGTANIVNQVSDPHNGFGLLTEEQQSVSGEVTVGTPAVYYSYSTDSATPTRLVSMTYPNGRILTYGFDTGTDDAVGRVSYLADSDGTVLAQYRYLGLDQIDYVNNPEPGVALDLGQKNNSGQLDNVNQFNRATDMVFADLGGANLDELKYGYDVSGNNLWEAQPTATANGAALDQLFGYDALNEVTSAEQGTLNGTDTAITNQNLAQDWSLDGMGNWSAFTQTGGTGPIDQQANTNALNEITSYQSPSAWATPGYDAAGNMTTTPQPGSEATGLTCVYDAWNRLIEVSNGSILALCSYDGLGRRITETANGQTTAYFYDSSDQVLEKRVSASPLPLGEGQGEGNQTTAAIIAALPANLQYVWGLRNVDDLVLRDSNNGGGGSLGISGSGLGLRLYALQDANWNVVALVNASGAVQERFSYTAFGTATALNPNFSSPYSGTNFHWTRLFAALDVDPTTGLYYNNARWYNSSLGVFLTTDPAMADPNTYRYAGNNPVTQTDPSGLVPPTLWTWDPDEVAIRDPQMLIGDWVALNWLGGGGYPPPYSYHHFLGSQFLLPDHGNPGIITDAELKDPNTQILVDGQPATNLHEVRVCQQAELESASNKANAARAAAGLPSPNSLPKSGYWDRYLIHVSTYSINVGPFVAWLFGGLWPKSVTPGKPPTLGRWPFTSVPRALGDRTLAARSAYSRGLAVVIGCATVGVGMYNWGVFISGFAYAAFPGSNGLPEPGSQ